MINRHPIRHEPFSAAFLVPSISALVGLIGVVIPFLRHTFIDRNRFKKGPISMAAIPRIDDHIGPTAIANCKIAQVEWPAPERVHTVGDVCPLRFSNREREIKERRSLGNLWPHRPRCRVAILPSQLFVRIRIEQQVIVFEPRHFVVGVIESGVRRIGNHFLGEHRLDVVAPLVDEHLVGVFELLVAANVDGNFQVRQDAERVEPDLVAPLQITV